MRPAPFEFSRLLSPLSAEAFFATTWERTHLHLARAQPGHYDALITAADLQRALNNPEARYPAIRMAQDGAFFPPEAYTTTVRLGDEAFTGVPDVRRIAEAYRRGATLVLPALHRTWAPLRTLCAALEDELDFAVHANAYITPANAAGFTPHYDVHEVFVLQIAGRKRWQLYAPGLKLPHRSQPCTPATYTGEAPFALVELQPGDLLYLPRGVLHATTTSDSYSAHVTVGVTVHTWVDLLKDTLASAIADEQLRAALPPGFARRGADLAPQMAQRLGQAVAQLQAQADPAALVAAYGARVRAGRAPVAEPLQLDVCVVQADTLVEAAPPAQFRLQLEADMALLEFRGTRYQLPGAVAPALQALVARVRCRPAELTDALELEARLGLVRFLLEIGFVRIVNP
jgi:hypothetical protein